MQMWSKNKLYEIVDAACSNNSSINRNLIIIDFHKYIGKVSDKVIFDWCRKAFDMSFHFDRDGEPPFSLKTYPSIVINTQYKNGPQPKDSEMMGTRDSTNCSYDSFFIVNAEDIFFNQNQEIRDASINTKTNIKFTEEVL